MKRYILPTIGLIGTCLWLPLVQAGDLSGRVTDTLNRGLAGVGVEVIDPSGDVAFVLTDKQGRYSVLNLPSGHYWVRLERDHRPRVIVPEGGIYHLVVEANHLYTLNFNERIGGAQVDFGTRRRPSKPQKTITIESGGSPSTSGSLQFYNRITEITPRQEFDGVSFELIFWFAGSFNDKHRGWAIAGHWWAMNQKWTEMKIKDAIDVNSQPLIDFSDDLAALEPCLAKMSTESIPHNGDFAAVTFFMNQQTYEALAGRVIEFRYVANALMDTNGFGPLHKVWLGFLGKDPE